MYEPLTLQVGRRLMIEIQDRDKVLLAGNKQTA